MLKRVLSIIVATAILCTMAIFAFAADAASLSVTVDDADLRPGEKVTATVQLNNYGDNWSAMSIDVTYNADLFALDGSLEDAVSYKGFLAGSANGFAEIFEVSPGLLRFVWMDTVNFDKADAEAIELVTLKLVVKDVEYTDSVISAGFAADGQLTTDSNGNTTPVSAGADTFSTEDATKNVFVGGVAEEHQPRIRLEIDKNRIQLNREVDAYIYIDKYMPWNAIAVALDYPADYLTVESVENIGFGSAEAQLVGNEIIINNGSDFDAAGSENLADGSLKVIKVTFKGKAVSENSFNISASFVEGGQSNDDVGTLKGGAYYMTEASSVTAWAVPDKTDLQVEIDAPENLQAGQEFDVYVKLNEHENEWAAFTLVGTYDPELFEVVDIDTENYDYGYTAVEPELTDDLEVVWISTENIKINSTNPTVMKVTFKALQACSAESITFAFKSDGVIAEDENGNLEGLTPGDHFTDEEKEVEVDVAPNPMKLAYALTDTEGNPITEIKAGKQFKVTVTVKDYYEKLAALSIKGSFSTDELELIAVDPLIEFGDGQFVSPDIAEINAGREDLDFVWISAENVALPDTFAAVTLTFMAKDTENATVNFSFIDEGVIRMDGEGMPETLAAGTYFETEPVPATVDVTAPKVLLKTVIEKDSENALMAGDEFTVKVYVVDYFSPLAAISIEGVLNEEIYEVMSYSAEILGGIEPIVDDEELEFVWISSENIVTDQQEFLALTLRVKAKRSTPDEIISFGFINGGMVRVDGSGTVGGLTAGEGYANPNDPADNALAIATVPVIKKPVEIVVETPNAGTVEAGDTFTVALSLSEFYEGDWSTFTIWADIDPNLEFVSAESVSLGETVVFAYTTENENNKDVVLSWVGLDNIASVPDNFVTLTFRAKEDAEINPVTLEPVDFYFAKAAMYTCADAETLDYQLLAEDGSAYKIGAHRFTIDVIAADTLVSFEVTWGALAYSYDFGNWNVETHQWDGAGWTCDKENGADKITVENTGGVGIKAEFAFTKNTESSYDLTNLTGAFIYNDAPLVGEVEITTESPVQIVLFALSGKTEQIWEDRQTVGEITVTITADGAIDEEVTQ